MGWDEIKGETYPQRSKEYAHDYRYFPEPDIPPLEISSEWIEKVRAKIPELPLPKKRRLIEEYGIRPYDAGLLVAQRAIADYFETAAKLGRDKQIDPQEVNNWITGELFRLLNESGLTIEAVGLGQSAKITPRQLVDLIDLRQKDTISVTAAKTVLQQAFKTGEEPQAIVDRLKLVQISDTDALAAIVTEVIEANPEQTAQYLGGKTAVIGWFVGQVMRATRGKANPQEAQRLLKDRLEQERAS